jgi:anti-sigma B factor antagonist
MDIKQETRAGWCAVALTGRADGTNSDVLESALVAAVQANPKVAIDLSNLDYISSAGLRSLLQGARAALERKSEFVLCSPKPSIKAVLDISGMPQIVRVEEKMPC